MQKVLTVSEITKQVKQVVEENFTGVKIIGEISNFKAHVSGHWYFTLKDGNSSINCTMWKGVNNYVFFVSTCRHAGRCNFQWDITFFTMVARSSEQNQNMVIPHIFLMVLERGSGDPCEES